MTEDGKFKVLVLSDHALSTSGVGTQTRHLIEGLLEKKCWSFRQFGAALKHQDYRTVVVNDDFVIKPIDGFGSPDLIRVTLATEKPDLLFIFTDPRFFTWLFDIEDEVHQVCPIVWWHVWDNYPYPNFNDSYYEATDMINCHSHMTYSMLKEAYPEKTNFIPHALPSNLFFQMTPEKIKEHKISLLGKDSVDNFVGIWVNRNAKRKRPSDLLDAWAKFVQNLEKTHGHRKATLIMHTEPLDGEGPNLFKVAEMLGIENNVCFSRDRIEFEKMNVLYNVSDFCINTSYAEGFGLSTLESMTTGTPIIAPKTGGLTRQVVDHRDGSHNGVALDVDFKTLVGSQSVPYIYEDYVHNHNFAGAMMKIFEMSNTERKTLSRKVKAYANEEFSMQKTIDLWHESMIKTIENFTKNRKNWNIEEI
jgi:glycosyltransferase involved in cell wall biosynthesis|tara:strand:+ start:41631 stop:42884 length:1254 start_codon:yes stop_codon:yes gene_type:complete